MKAFSRASVSVLLTTPQHKILLQLRDDIPDIEYPGHWSLIAGWIREGEDPMSAMIRELNEELEILQGQSLSLGPISFLGCDKRNDRPWTEYVFCACLQTPLAFLKIREGRGFQAFSPEQFASLGRVAPHHRRYVTEYLQHDDSFTLVRSAPKEVRIETIMKTISDYIEVSQLGVEKDYPALEEGDGYVVSNTTSPTAALHPKSEVRFIALIKFADGVPRGNHYHTRKVEHMVVLRGKLRCTFGFPDIPKETMEITLEPGQMVRVLPGCVHTYTALGGDVLALEYAPQRYESGDVIEMR